MKVTYLDSDPVSTCDSQSGGEGQQQQFKNKNTTKSKRKKSSSTATDDNSDISGNGSESDLFAFSDSDKVDSTCVGESDGQLQQNQRKQNKTKWKRKQSSPTTNDLWVGWTKEGEWSDPKKDIGAHVFLRRSKLSGLNCLEGYRSNPARIPFPLPTCVDYIRCVLNLDSVIKMKGPSRVIRNGDV